MDNDLFSKFNKNELDELISLIISFDFKLRDKLNIDKNTTFGLEIECEYALWDVINQNKNESYTLVEETSLGNGAELKSPILTDTYETWIILKEIILDLSIYASVYLLIGSLVMVISWLVNRKNR